MAKSCGRMDASKPPRKFGMFTPGDTSSCLSAVRRTQNRYGAICWMAAMMKDDLHILDTNRVLEGSTADLEHLSPIIRALGSEDQIMESHRADAAAGHSFLIAYAPSDLDAQRLMNVARREGFLRAQKYDRFSFTEL